jgi:hypothetical protein
VFAIALVGVIPSSAFGLQGNQLRIALLIFVIGFFAWPYMGRIIRGQTLSLREREFVDAARSLGARGPYILFRELLPNLVAPILVYATLLIPVNLLFEAALSYLGVGIGFRGWREARSRLPIVRRRCSVVVFFLRCIPRRNLIGQGRVVAERPHHPVPGRQRPVRLRGLDRRGHGRSPPAGGSDGTDARLARAASLVSDLYQPGRGPGPSLPRMGSSYHQFCPVAKAMELLDERWTMPIVREPVTGSQHFNDLLRGVPRMSPTLHVGQQH